MDINGDFPQVLMEIDPDDEESPIKKTYIWANNQLLAQYDGDTPNPIYFYLHDRLGSVRNVVHYESDPSPIVKVDHSYTYNPYGETLIHNAASVAVTNDFRFAGYVWDDVIDQYFCNARWYDPVLTRFTGMDPVRGKFREPLTLHKYLYCMNNPINRIDPNGKMSFGEICLTTALGAALGGMTTGAGYLGYIIGSGEEFNSRDFISNIFLGAFIGGAASLGGSAFLSAIGIATPALTLEVAVGSLYAAPKAAFLGGLAYGYLEEAIVDWIVNE